MFTKVRNLPKTLVFFLSPTLLSEDQVTFTISMPAGYIQDVSAALRGDDHRAPSKGVGFRVGGLGLWVQGIGIVM